MIYPFEKRIWVDGSRLDTVWKKEESTNDNTVPIFVAIGDMDEDFESAATILIDNRGELSFVIASEIDIDKNDGELVFLRDVNEEKGCLSDLRVMLMVNTFSSFVDIRIDPYISGECRYIEINIVDVPCFEEYGTMPDDAVYPLAWIATEKNNRDLKHPDVVRYPLKSTFIAMDPYSMPDRFGQFAGTKQNVAMNDFIVSHLMSFHHSFTGLVPGAAVILGGIPTTMPFMLNLMHSTKVGIISGISTNCPACHGTITISMIDESSSTLELPFADFIMLFRGVFSVDTAVITDDAVNICMHGARFVMPISSKLKSQIDALKHVCDSQGIETSDSEGGIAEVSPNSTLYAIGDSILNIIIGDYNSGKLIDDILIINKDMQYYIPNINGLHD